MCISQLAFHNSHNSKYLRIYFRAQQQIRQFSKYFSREVNLLYGTFRTLLKLNAANSQVMHAGHLYAYIQLKIILQSLVLLCHTTFFSMLDISYPYIQLYEANSIFCRVSPPSSHCTLQIFPDNACRREILSLEVYCNYMSGGCTWTGPLRMLDVNIVY